MNGNREKIQQLAHYIRRNPDDSFSKFALALELLKNNQVQKALILFESIYRNDPEYLGIYYHLGKLYQRTGRPKDAENCFRKGIGVAAMKGEQRTLSELEDALMELKEENNHEN